MSLTSSNARMSVFGLATAAVAGGIGAGIASLLGFGWELQATAVVFTVAGVLAVPLPRPVDVPTGELPADGPTPAEIPLSGRGLRRGGTPGGPAPPARGRPDRRAPGRRPDHRGDPDVGTTTAAGEHPGGPGAAGQRRPPRTRWLPDHLHRVPGAGDVRRRMVGDPGPGHRRRR